MKAIWNKKIIAESNATILFEGNHYFPPNAVNQEYINCSETYTTCNNKGQACFYTIAVNGQINIDAAWYYPTPNHKIKEIANYIAFWKGIEITD